MANRILVTCVSATGVCFAIHQIAGSLLTPQTVDLPRPRRQLIRHSPEPFLPMRGALLRGASHEPKDVFSRALFPNARGALVFEGVLHVGAMGVALCRAGGNPVLAPCLGDVDDQVKPTQRA